MPLPEQIHGMFTELERSRARLPQSTMGKAVAHSSRHGEMPRVYPEDGGVEIVSPQETKDEDEPDY